MWQKVRELLPWLIKNAHDQFPGVVLSLKRPTTTELGNSSWLLILGICQVREINSAKIMGSSSNYNGELGNDSNYQNSGLKSSAGNLGVGSVVINKNCARLS